MPRLPFRSLALTVSLLMVGALVVTSGGSSRAEAVTVRPGDTLWALAHRYRVSLDQLAHVNAMKLSDILPVGRTLIVPGQSTAPATAPPPAPPRQATVPSGRTRPFTPAELSQMASFCVSFRPSTRPGGLPQTLRQHPERLALRPLFARWSRAYAVPADLVEAIAWHESGWQNNVTSSANARGIGQLLPSTAAFVSGTLLGVKLNLTVASDNIQMTSRFLAYLLGATRGNVCEAVASYYQGLGGLRRFGVLPASQVYVRSVFALRPLFS